MGRKKDTPKEPVIQGLNRAKGYTRLRGLLHHEHTQDGRTIAKAWPKKRGPTTDPAQINRQGNFAIARNMAHDPLPYDNIAARGWSKGTAMLPGDFLTKAAYGTMWEVTTTDGKQFWSLRNVRASVAAALDTFTARVGSILTRLDAGWNYLNAGNPGDILTSNGPDVPISWHAPPAIAAPQYEFAWFDAPDGVETGGHASKCVQFIPLANMIVRFAAVNLTNGTGNICELSLIQFTGTGFTVAAVIGRVILPASPDNQSHTYLGDFGNDYILTAGVTYGLDVTCTNRTTTTSPGTSITGSAAKRPACPIDVRIERLTRDSIAVPIVGNTYSQSAVAPINAALGYKWTT